MRCPSCHHRFPVIRESVEHPGRAVQSADHWDRLVEAGRVARADRSTVRSTLGELVTEVQSVYGHGELRSYASAVGIPYGQLRYALTAEQQSQAAAVSMMKNEKGNGAEWWQLLELLSCCMTVSLVFVSLTGLISGLVFLRLRRRRSHSISPERAS